MLVFIIYGAQVSVSPASACVRARPYWMQDWLADQFADEGESAGFKSCLLHRGFSAAMFSHTFADVKFISFSFSKQLL